MELIKEIDARELCEKLGRSKDIKNKTHTRTKKNFLKRLERIRADLAKLGIVIELQKWD
jgi:hypothetical protein